MNRDKTIEDHNRNASRKGYELAHNHLSDLNDTELANLRGAISIKTKIMDKRSPTSRKMWFFDDINSNTPSAKVFIYTRNASMPLPASFSRIFYYLFRFIKLRY